MSEIWTDTAKLRDAGAYFDLGKDTHAMSHHWRTWLRIVPKTNVLAYHGLSKSSGEIFALIEQIIEDSKAQDKEAIGGVWYLPIKQEDFHVAPKSEYDKITPSLGGGSKMLADVAGGVMNKAGQFISKFSAGAGGAVSGAGKFVQQLAGDIDGPVVWNGASIGDFDFSVSVGFSNYHEYQYYKAVSTVLTLMTMPIKGAHIDIVSKVLKEMGASERAQSYKMYLMQKPPSACSLEVQVGYASDIDTEGKALEVLHPNGSLKLFKADDMLLVDAKGEDSDNSVGLDGWGVSRSLKMSIRMTPLDINAVLDGYKSMLKSNAYKAASIPDIVTDSMVNNVAETEPSVSQSLNNRIDQADKDREATYYKVKGSKWNKKQQYMDTSAQAISFSMSGARVQRAAGKLAKNISKAILYNVFSMNSSITSVLYVGARIVKNVGPSRVIVSAGKVSGFSNAKTTVSAGIPGLLVRQARSVAKVFGRS